MILLLFFVFSLLSLTAGQASAGSSTCYKRDGSRQTAKNWLPCYPDRQRSSCCDENDFCMSNQLCLNTVANQYFTAQGCSDPTWQSCNSICNATIRNQDGYINVWMCSGNIGAGTARYCCGRNNTCCNDDERNLLTIAIAKDVFRPPGAAAASASASSTSALSPLPSSSSSSSGDNNNSSSNNNNSRGLAIGLGVGIPMGLALLGGIVFLGLQLRKWTAATQRTSSGEETKKGDGVTSGGPPDEAEVALPQQQEQGQQQQQHQQMYLASELHGHGRQEL